MRKTAVFRNQLFVDHDPGFDQIERPDRVKCLFNDLDSLADKGFLFTEPSTRAASKAELLLNHTDAHIKDVEDTDGKIYSVLSEDTFTSSKSYEAACHASGAMVMGIDMLLEGSITNGFALVRPPGHHAEKDKPMGFCLFNHVAVAAHHANKTHGLNRILIVDYDVHHGNGTQRSFYESKEILYISIHQSPFYPETGSLEEVGKDEGEGYTVNIPLPGGQGDLEYANIFNTVIMPICRQFKPEIILVSAGFDGHFADEISSIFLTHKGYSYMTKVLVDMAEEYCEGKILFTLEGGYNLNGLREGVFAVLSQLTDREFRMEFPTSLSPEMLSQLENERSLHPAIYRVHEIAKKYWNL